MSKEPEKKEKRIKSDNVEILYWHIGKKIKLKIKKVLCNFIFFSDLVWSGVVSRETKMQKVSIKKRKIKQKMVRFDF